MKIISLIVLPTLLAVSTLSAAILTVDNNPGSVAMFTSIQAAHDAASPGDTETPPDTILVAGSTTGYGTLNAYKKLNWVGTGFWLAENSVPGLSSNDANIQIQFKKDGFFGDSSGSTCTGLSGKFESDAGVTGIEIDKCSNAGPNHNWTFNGPVTVTRSFLKNSTLAMNATGSSISNSIVSTLRLKAENIIVDHCVVRALIETRDTCTISNTIFHELTNAANWDQTGNASYSYCVMIGADFLPAGSNNIPGSQFIQNVLVATGSVNRDAYYQLSEGSVAKGAGLAGADIGAFGGSNPYVLSGVPGIPRMTRLTVPSTATGLTALTFEVEAQAFAE